MAGQFEIDAIRSVCAELRALEKPGTTLQDWLSATDRMETLAEQVKAQGGYLELEGFERARMKFEAGVK